MSKYLEILEDLRHRHDECLVSLIGALLTAAEDVAYAYDITEEMTERLKEVLDEHDVRCQIVEEDIDEDFDEPCDCYSIERKCYFLKTEYGESVRNDYTVGICNGTRERDQCNCGGDTKKCDFYEEVRNGKTKRNDR